LNHLRLLRQTLDRAGLTVEDILAQADPDVLKKQYRKAGARFSKWGTRIAREAPG